MSDITALEQREKFEAWVEADCALSWGCLKQYRNTYGSYSVSDYACMWDAWKAATAEMVEALEKAQNWERQWKEAAERRGKILTRQALDILREGQRVTELENALKQMIQAHKTTLRTGYERIVDLGGDCDSPDVMIAGNPEIQQAEKLLTASIAIKGGVKWPIS